MTLPACDTSKDGSHYHSPQRVSFDNPIAGFCSMIHGWLQRVFSTISHCSHQNNPVPEAERDRRERAVVAHRSSPRRVSSLQGLLLRVRIVLRQQFAGLFLRAEAHRLFRSEKSFRRSVHQTARRHQQRSRQSRAHNRQHPQPTASPMVCDRRKRGRFQNIARLRQLFGWVVILSRRGSAHPRTDSLSLGQPMYWGRQQSQNRASAGYCARRTG